MISANSASSVVNHAIWRNHYDGARFVRREQVAFRPDDDWDNHWRLFRHFGYDGDWCAAVLDRKRHQLSRLEYFPVREIARQHEREWRREKEIPEPSEYYLSAGAPLLEADGRPGA